MKSSVPIVKDLVLVGGGHAHVAVLKRFGMKNLSGARLTLITTDVHTPYSGMLPGFIAGHYTLDECHIDLRPLARFAGARIYHDTATGLDLVARRVICRDRPPVPYDVLSIDIGSTPAVGDVPGAAEFVTPVKPIGGFVARWQALAERVLATDAPLRIALVGAGAGGVELTLAIQHRLALELKSRGHDDANARFEFHLITDMADILTTYDRFTRAKFNRVLARRGVTVHTDTRVVEVTDGALVLAGGATIPADEILWVTQAAAQGWLKDTGLGLDKEGFIAVDDCYRAISHDDVFAAGDICHMLAAPRPKAGVYAVRAGPPLARNLRRALVGKPPRPHRPQSRFLSLISTGDRYAVASRNGFALAGGWVWRWKDWIDRRWMEKYTDLPEMEDDEEIDIAAGLVDAVAIKEISAIAMRCGGCGAKVGATVLARVMNDLVPVDRDDVLVGLDAPDDAAVVEVPAGKVMVHTVDYFRSFVDDPYVFGRIAANHALGDVFAMGAEPQSALAVATIPFGPENKVEDTLRDLMKGAMEVLAEAGASLVGGHTSEGAELALGFSVNGLADMDTLMRKVGLRPGDALVLTKPIGTGTLFAADMQSKARGRWIDAALDHMVQSNQNAARCLRRHGAKACTDVTGFGLLGHLVEMARPSAVDVEVVLDALPVMDGAVECIENGIFSSLQPQNVRLRRAIRRTDGVGDGAGNGVGDRAGDEARFALLFDPQTAGGLLAGVPANNADSCIEELVELGYTQAAVIGRVLEQSDALEPVTVV